MDSSTLSSQEIRRYVRHISLPEFGIAGQEKLKKSKILLIGVGCVGTYVLQNLVAAGVGVVGIVDHETIEDCNLLTHNLFTAYDIGKLKTIEIRKKLQEQNPLIQVEIYNTSLTEEFANSFIKHYDIVVDCTDNKEVKYQINDSCISLGKPFVYSSVNKYQGEVAVLNFKNGPSYRCLYPENSEFDHKNSSFQQTGMFNIVPSMVGAIQAAEVLKVLVGLSKPNSGKLISINVLDLQIRIENIKKNLSNFPIQDGSDIEMI